MNTAKERKKLEKQAKKKGLWGSIGRTLGGLAAGVLTGGLATPLMAGLAASAGSFVGGAIGANQVKIGKGEFYSDARKDLRKDLGTWGSENVTGALSSGLKAGVAQTASLAAKGVDPSTLKGLDVKGSLDGRFFNPTNVGLKAGNNLLSGNLEENLISAINDPQTESVIGLQTSFNKRLLDQIEGIKKIKSSGSPSYTGPYNR